MIAAKHVRQPGPTGAQRLESGIGAASSLDFTLEPGLSLNDAIGIPLQRAGVTTAGVTLHRTRFRPFRYVIPAYAPDADHAAYYSETFAPPDEIELETATLTFGRRADGPFLHCHALWRDASGQRRGGHVLPMDAIVCAPGQATAFGTTQVEMRSEFDPETNFTLFRPVVLAPPAPGPRCLVARIRPNEDLVEGVEALCRQHGVARGTIHSGIGSTIGVTFDDGRVIADRPTELLTIDGRIEPGADGHPTARLPLAVIDVHGAIHHGTPARGDNPVLICFEMILQPL